MNILYLNVVEGVNIYIYLLLSVFIIHEFEEFYMLKKWKNNFLKKDKSTLSNKFIVTKIYEIDSFSFRATIIEEILIVTGLLIYSSISQDYNIFIGLLVAYTLHIIVHLVQTILARMYLPFTLTSFLSIIYSAFAIYYIINQKIINSKSMIYIVLTVLITYLNLFIMLNVFKRIRRRMSNKA